MAPSMGSMGWPSPVPVKHEIFNKPLSNLTGYIMPVGGNGSVDSASLRKRWNPNQFGGKFAIESTTKQGKNGSN